jgi:hypothetical protein
MQSFSSGTQALRTTSPLGIIPLAIKAARFVPLLSSAFPREQLSLTVKYETQLVKQC